MKKLVTATVVAVWIVAAVLGLYGLYVWQQSQVLLDTSSWTCAAKFKVNGRCAVWVNDKALVSLART